MLEEVADNRSYDTWQERVQAAVKRVGLELRYIVSDRGNRGQTTFNFFIGDGGNGIKPVICGGPMG